MNILFVEDFLKPSNGGVERVTYLISQELERRGQHCFVAFSKINDDYIPEERKLQYSLEESKEELIDKFCNFVRQNNISVVINQQEYGDKHYITKVSHPYFIGAFGLNCFTSAHKYWKLTLT